MRRDELLHLARRILQNIGITHGTATNSKRWVCEWVKKNNECLRCLILDHSVCPRQIVQQQNNRSWAFPFWNLWSDNAIPMLSGWCGATVRWAGVSEHFHGAWLLLLALKAKLGQIPIEVEALRYEQNKLLQQLKQNTLDPSISADNTGLKKQIDDLGKRIEQLSDEERNLRRLIRKRNMR